MKLRWKVQRTVVADLRFGEDTRDVIRWAVTPSITGSTTSISGTASLTPTYFRSWRGAIDYAFREARRVYRGAR